MDPIQPSTIQQPPPLAEPVPSSSSSQTRPSPEGWRGELQAPPPHFTPDYVRRFQARFQQLLCAKQPDPLGPILANLASDDAVRTEAETLQLGSIYSSSCLFANLIPEQHRESIIQDERLTMHHEGLVPLRALRKRLLKFREAATTPSICRQLKDLSGYYNRSLRELLNSKSGEERKKLLEPMTQVWHDGFFVIPVELARELTSCDAAGRTVKQNRYGSRPVVQRGGLFLKVGASGTAIPPDPASEYAVSSLCHLLSPSKMIAVPSGMFYVRGSELCAGGLVQASLAVGEKSDRPLAIPLNELLDVINSFDLFKGHYGSIDEPDKKWKELLEWSTQQHQKEVDSDRVLKEYLRWMSSIPSNQRCTEFMNPEDLPEDERQRSFFARGDQWDYQLGVYQSYLASYPPPVWDKLLTLLKAHPTFMQGQSLCTLLRLSKALEWIQKLFPDASLKEIAPEIPHLLDKIDRDALSRLFLASLATNPNDGKDDNYVIRITWDRKRIAGLVVVGVDNDLAFKHPILKGSHSHYLRTKCLLYALRKQMLKERIPAKVRAFFQGRTGDELFLQWLAKLDRQNQRLLRAQQAAGCSSKLAMGFPKGALNRVLKHLRKICSLLKCEDVSLDSVFQGIEPVVYHCYDEAREQTRNANEALGRLDFKRGAPLEELLKKRFASVELGGPRIPLREAIREMGADDNEEFDTGGKQKKNSLSQSVQSATQELTFSSVPHSLSQLKLLSELSFASELQLRLTQLQARELLKIAIASMDPDLARLSLVNGANPNPKTGSHPVAKTLLKAKSNPDKAEQLLWVLLKHGADPNHKNRAGRPLLHCLVPTIEKHPKLSERLLAVFVAHGADLEWKHPRTHATFLDWAIQRERPVTFVVLVRQGAGRKVDAAAALRFARNPEYRQVEGMSNALKLLEQCCPEISWIQDLEAVKVEKPLKGSFEIEGASTGKIHLNPSVVQQIGITAKGKFPEKPRVQYGRHCVRPIVHQGRMLMAKDSPELAGNEFLVCATHSIIGHGVPKTDLFKYRNALGVSTPLQLAQLIDGENFREVFYSAKGLERLEQLDTELLHNLILLKIATRPGDDKTENFILRGKELICIDNDRAWMPSHLVICVLFCLDQMNNRHVHPRTRARFLALDPEKTVRDWLERCLTRNERYAELFDHQERKKQYNRDTEEPVIIQMVLPHKTAPRFYQALCRIQEALKDPDATPIDVLLHAEPAIGRRYEKLFNKKHRAARDRWRIIRNAHYPTVCEAGGRLTRTTTLDMFRHYHIDPKIVLEKEPSHFLKSEFNQLNRACQEGEEIGLARKELLEGKSERFRGFLLDVHREKALQGYPFGQNDHYDTGVLFAIEGLQASFRHLSLAGLQTAGLQAVGLGFFERRQSENKRLVRILTLSPALKSLNMSEALGVDTDLVSQQIPTLCRHLRELRLNRCHGIVDVWSRTSWLTLPSLRHLEMRECPKLTRFNLRAHQLKLLDLTGCTKLERLALDTPFARSVCLNACPRITDEDLKSLATSLPNARLTQIFHDDRDLGHLTHIREHCLQLTQYPLTTFSRPVLELLEKTTCGTDPKLVIPGTLELDQPHWLALSVALKHSQSITAVTIDRRPLASERPNLIVGFSTKIAEAISDAINFNSRMTRIKLRLRKVATWDEFVRRLKGNQHLSSFASSCDTDQSRYASSLAEGILQNPSLTSLNLSSNFLDSSNFQLKRLQHLSALVHLNLSSNPFKDRGIVDLMSSIHSLRLTSLNVASTAMGDEGLESLAQFVGENRTLQKLNIGSNGPFSTDKLTRFGNSLVENYTLKDLSIWTNFRNDESARSFLRSVQRNRTLTAMDLPKAQPGSLWITEVESMNTGTVLEFREFINRNRQKQRLRQRPPPLQEQLRCRDTAWAMIDGWLTQRMKEVDVSEDLIRLVVAWPFPRLRHRRVNPQCVREVLARRFPKLAAERG